MLVYINSGYKCHTAPGKGRRAFDVPFFDGKCPAFIEGYRYIPEGETWTNPAGVKCTGVSPWKDYNTLAAAQREADAAEREDMKSALSLLGVE